MGKRPWESGTGDLEKQIVMLADLIRASEYLVVYTGAGISTSAGIPDYRGPQGAHRLRAQGIPTPRRGAPPVRPTIAHMALVALQNADKMKHLVSQNTDGLHRRSGIAQCNISELHGNTNVETCHACDAEHWRRFSTRNIQNQVHDHRTTRRCEDCGQWLHDSIVNFNEQLRASTIQTALYHSQKADMALVLGSSLRVAPAADLPLHAATHGKGLVIVNHQKTPLDKFANACINADIDDVMMAVMKHLGYEIPPMVDLFAEAPIIEKAESAVDLSGNTTDKEEES